MSSRHHSHPTELCCPAMKRIGIFIVLYYHIFASRFPCSLPPRRPIQRAYVPSTLVWFGELYGFFCVFLIVGDCDNILSVILQSAALYRVHSIATSQISSYCIASNQYASMLEITKSFKMRNFSIYWLLIDFILVLVFRIMGPECFFSDSRYFHTTLVITRGFH